ncbi:ParM/StbA family protein [Limosilactobacillus mucosae]|uniref:ParM/StbA family protein n=1 Tax=Limosilactobacillus mucosae TaxID=97478 RepID=UPI0022E5E518|nr:ParM/StbA family protein [Limosilactobacillus mucosae]
MENLVNVTIAHDGGNGYMKDSINGERSVFPSTLSIVTPGHEGQVIDVEDVKAVQAMLEDYMNNMDVTVQSGGVKANGRYLVGGVATRSGNPVMGFNVNSTEGKYTSDVSIIPILALTAYHVTNMLYHEHGELPKALNVVVDKMITALPIDEYKQPGVKEQYANRFLKHEHVVIINNFSHPITITISFSKVNVQPEGVIAMFGLIGDTNGNYRNDDLFKKFREQYDLPKFNGESVLKIGNVLGIDIGDGTVDFSVMNGISPVPEFNSSLLMGIGNVIENAAEALHRQYPTIGLINRQSFMQIVDRGRGKESQVYLSFLNNQLLVLENAIDEKIKTIYSRLNGQIDLIVVSGGGAVTLANHYFDRLSKVLDDLSPFGAAPILWVPKQYAQMLNLDGLEFALKKI